MERKITKSSEIRNEKDYYDFVDYVKEKHNNNEITTEEMEAILEMAKKDECKRRRIEREALMCLINDDRDEIKEGESGYYAIKISDFIHEKHLNCEWNLLEVRQAFNYNFWRCYKMLKDLSNEDYNKACKLIYDDLVNGVIDIRYIEYDELYKMYTERL